MLDSDNKSDKLHQVAQLNCIGIPWKINDNSGDMVYVWEIK